MIQFTIDKGGKRRDIIETERFIKMEMSGIVKKIFILFLSVIFLFTLVGGVTFALFTASATNANNNFTAGTVNIELNDDPDDEITSFSVNNIAPGDSDSATIKVDNEGSLELRYGVSIDVEGDLFTGSSPLVVTLLDAEGHVLFEASSDDIFLLNRVLSSNTSEDLTVKWYLPLEANNDYQNKSGSFDLIFHAEQTRNSTFNNFFNAGFETGNLSGWTVLKEADEIVVTDGDDFTTPYYGSYMVRLGNPYENQPIGDNTIAQNFIVTSTKLEFVYNIFTQDYDPFDKFEYIIKVVDPDSSTIIDEYHTNAGGVDTGNGVDSTGWKKVSLDLTGYDGQEVQVIISAGGTDDNLYPTWAYVNAIE